MRMNQPKEPCIHGIPCGFIATDRNRYFTGKYMTARDFYSEQAYFLSRHRLHNRLLHGWGIVCGLRVLHHPKDECKERWVVVRAGIAIDCCGRELVLHEDTPYELPLPRPAEEDQKTPSETRQSTDKVMTGPFLLCLRYGEEQIEKVPALYAESKCDPGRQEANRVRESARLEVCSLDEVEPECWRIPEGDMEARCRDDCDDELPGPAGICLEPECPCGERVPLALIRPRELIPPGEPPFEIDLEGRRTLPVPEDFLTHIVGINWPHGGEVSVSHLSAPVEEGGMDGRLEVRFDRKLLPAEGDATGINAFTFIVQYGGIQEDIEFLPFDRIPDKENPTLEEDCLAVFAIDPDYLRPRRNLANNRVYVTLKCDFILDCHGNPVDGNHLRGRLPSGNGVPGGDFVSWFNVLPDRGDREEAR